MDHRKKTQTEVFSYATIVISMALMSGLALGHVTEKSMNPRLSAEPPADPVERFGLGQNAYETTNAYREPIRAQGPEYAEASYEIGRYVDGARVLLPFEPARKTDRIRLERLQSWNDENFGSAVNLDDGGFGYAESDFEDYEPIDVGAVADSPESGTEQTALYDAIDDHVIEQNDSEMDAQQISGPGVTDSQPVRTDS
ncbi:hypothetical protein [Parasphingorhabdus sp.]|uniref:hypothetical protein n=1 Tax=Parasphingorhabdus sp. TaxID=2709688 RepID=UPI003A8E11DB